MNASRNGSAPRPRASGPRRRAVHLGAWLAVCLMAAAPLAQARPDHPGGHGHGRAGMSQRDGGPAWQGSRHHSQQARAAHGARGGSRHAHGHGYAAPVAWHRGQSLPSRYLETRYAVPQWHAHRLPPPGHGQRWVHVGADYLLIGIATGLIVGSVLAR